ncbi:MAG: SDR family oxidoreductase [Xanthomonadales bacterium]|nr:SDR family oxidoreductase [Xanthomonadales bacterium]
MFRIFTLMLISLVVLFGYPNAQADTSSGQKAVLVTGASSGLGRAMTEMMASKGYFVYAGARKDKDMQELNAIENVQAVRLDVTKQDEIDAAVKTISNAGRGLYGLVNNAGVVVLMPLVEIDEKDFNFQMNVNVYGPYRVTRAFAPLIIESNGRISTIGSISGTLSSATWGPYSMSKHAMEAFHDALADEMKRFGVKVSLIEPGTYQSKIGTSAVSRMEQREQKLDGSEFKTDMDESVEFLTTTLAQSGDPNEVAETVMQALFDENPKSRYLIVPNQEQARWTINRAIQRLVEQNSDQKYSYDREALIEMLDQALAAPTP